MHVQRWTSLFRDERIYWFLTSVLRLKERDTILKMLTTPKVQHISCRLFLIYFRWSGSEKLKRRRNGRKLNSMPENSIVCLHGPMLTFNCMVGLQLLNTMVGPQLPNTMVGPQFLNTIVGPQLNLFQNLPNSLPISSGHDVIHNPGSFSVWGLL